MFKEAFKKGHAGICAWARLVNARGSVIHDVTERFAFHTSERWSPSLATELAENPLLAYLSAALMRHGWRIHG